MKKFLLFILVLAINIMPALSKELAQAQQTETDSDSNVQQEQTSRENMEYISKSQYPISVIDPTPQTNPAGTYYPGLRAGNQLIIYTPGYGERTGTNEFGKEAVVRNGVVVSLSGSDSPIPSDGFVISVHGRAKTWLDANVIVGAHINIDSETGIIESIILPESYTFQAEQKISDVKRTMAEYKSKNVNYRAPAAENFLAQAEHKLKQANIYLQKNDFIQVQELANAASTLADNALYNVIPAKAGEFHGVWLRPVEKTPDEISKTLDKLKATGIENVFVETYYQGYTIFPSKTLEAYGVRSQRTEFQRWDPLKVWVEEAHKRGMKVHVWFQTFYAGNENISKNPQHVLSAHPDWANVQKRYYNAGKPTPSVSEHNGYFLDPANPAVQKYLTDLLSEIVNNYAVDGLNIDYIRYPVSLYPRFPNYIESTWGYSAYARNEFCALYGIDPVTLTVDNPLWQTWVDYRKNKITEFVSKLRPVVENKKVLISTVIFPSPEEGAVVKLQDWKYWGANNLVDAFTPLIMGSDALLAENHITYIRQSAGDKVKIFAGLFQPFVSGSPADLLYQIKASRDAGAAGIVIFDYAHLSQEFQNALKARVFSN